jgi:hypothetical protein
MPAVRAISWNATTVTSGTTLVIPMPESTLNDLLLAIIVADTGTGTWTSSGWTHVTGSPSTNTCQLVVMWKLAIASEAASYTFTSTVAESYNGAIVSIRDVNTSTPFGATPVISFANQAAAAKFNFPTITTNTANSLVMYASASSVSGGVPSILEGPAFGLLGADGQAECLGIGWGFKATAGTTASNVGCSNVATGAGRVMVLQIAPPSGGATVIPPYCTADSSVYVDPINGTTAYNTNTALAATADTGFSTSLGGLTAADATVAAATDVGINSFHSAGRVTSISASTNLSGAELVLATANRPNVTGKNVLVHVGPSTEGQLQRFSSVASGRGMWFGMRSAAASNWKIWQVYGVERGSLRHQPVVINEAAGNTKSTNGTLSPSSIFAFGFWTSGTGVTTTVWDYASLWVLDTTTVCGGNAAEPLSIAGIVAAAATGKERRSVILQGAKQMLAYQPIKLGNAGTDPVYLDLDATAIEFPRLYNEATAEVTYNSTVNVAGITYEAGASDTIKHRNSVVSSSSQYHWRISASSSASATYDFSGLALIGAGDVVLRDLNTAFSLMTFSGCGTITANSAEIEDCIIKGATATAVITAAPQKIKRCKFTSAGTGHAIEITTAGTYTFEGNTFTGYGAGGTTDAAVYNNSGGAVTLNVTAGGGTPTVRNGAGASTTVNANVSVTLTGLKNPSEVRVFSAGTQTEVAGTGGENVTSGSHAFSVGSGVSVDISILALGYQNMRLLAFSSTSDTTVPISQVLDRQYANAA